MKILETDSFIIQSSSDIPALLAKLRIIKNNNILIHILSFLHNSELIQNLKSELGKLFPHAKIALLRYDEESQITLTVYTLQKDAQIQDLSDEILSLLYKDNVEKDSNIRTYRNKLFSRYFIDNLTNLPNIYQLRRDIDENEEFSLILLNIDNFQVINSFYGFIIGDFVIEKIGRYLKKNIINHKVYRLPGDEFALVVDKNMYFYDLKDHLTDLYKQLKDIVVVYQGLSIYIDVTLASSANIDNTNIFSKVSMALMHAKKNGSHFWIYENKMNFENSYEKNVEFSKIVRDAISNFRIIPFYQAIINTKTSKIVKYECLARLIDIDGKILSPLDFIPITKQIKSYNILTRTIIDKSFETFENSDFEFSINLSIEDIVDKDMFVFIMEKLRNSKVSHKVTFEILESDAIEDFVKVERFIIEVRRYGAKIAIDDFGSGYSNFSYLTKINADYIKIDGSIIRDMDIDKNALIIVETIVEFARKLGVKTVAEYVHSSAIMSKVKEFNIDYSQGYYIGMPSLLETF